MIRYVNGRRYYRKTESDPWVDMVTGAIIGFAIDASDGDGGLGGALIGGLVGGSIGGIIGGVLGNLMDDDE